MLKKKIKQKGIIRSLGAHDVFSALIAEQAGFDTVFIGGFGTSASLLGQPDLNLLTLTEMANAVGRFASRLRIPVVADGDTGHGGIHNVQRTVQEFEKAGAAGLVLEDQVSPKRCGHFEGKSVISASEMVTKLKAAKAAQRRKDFVIIARTDARDTHGLNEAIRRVNLYAKAGADVVFIESPHSEKELKLIPRKVRAPLLVNMLTGGKTPNLPISTLARFGYKIVVYPIESLLIFAPVMRRLARAILKDGDIEKIKDQMISFKEVKKILGLEKFISSS